MSNKIRPTIKLDLEDYLDLKNKANSKIVNNEKEELLKILNDSSYSISMLRNYIINSTTVFHKAEFNNLLEFSENLIVRINKITK